MSVLASTCRNGNANTRSIARHMRYSASLSLGTTAVTRQKRRGNKPVWRDGGARDGYGRRNVGAAGMGARPE